MKKTIYQEALNINELRYSLENISQDDQKAITDYTQEEILAEAVYVLSKFTDAGWIQNETLNGQDGKEEQDKAKQEVKELKKFIKKWSV